MQQVPKERIRWATGVFALLLGLWTVPLGAHPAVPSDAVAAAPHLAPISASVVVWTLGSISRIGGCVPTILGKPQADEARRAVIFNGVDEGIVVPVNPIAGWAQFTIEVLFEPATGGAAEQRFVHLEDERGARALLELRSLEDGRWCLDTFLFSGTSRLALIDRTRLHPAGRWYWVALRYDGRRMASFVNGTAELEGEVAVPPLAAGRTSLGVRLNQISWFKGAIREVRFHSTALAPEQLQRAP
jgi:hypothetical protein